MRRQNESLRVMAGLRPGHPRLKCSKAVDARHKAGHDELLFFE
jgi:hypothetical protein